MAEWMAAGITVARLAMGGEVEGALDDGNGRIPYNSLMHHDDLYSTLRQSAAVKLLQSQNAPLILSFLVAQFKLKQRVTIPHTELIEHLTAYLEALQESHPGLYGGTAVAYLRLWCDDDHRFLRRYYESGRDDPVYELTPDAERAIAWVEELQKSDFVGTESRFLRIFDLLQEIVTYGMEDVAARLAQLEKEKAQLQAQIDAIQATDQVLTLPPVNNGVALWGKGFQVSLLRELGWLAACAIWYWGDLDAPGFAILSQLRGYWPQTRSFLMDAATLAKYRAFVVAGTPVGEAALANLDVGETAVYHHLLTHNLRLEQERISQQDVAAVI